MFAVWCPLCQSLLPSVYESIDILNHRDREKKIIANFVKTDFSLQNGCRPQQPFALKKTGDCGLMSSRRKMNQSLSGREIAELLNVTTTRNIYEVSVKHRGCCCTFSQLCPHPIIK